jgi:predicted adenylyl cyclase CyaB
MDKTQEVEKRALISKESYEKAVAILGKLGAKEEGKVRLRDTYFCPKSVRSFSEIEMDTVGSFSIRLREQGTGPDLEKSINIKVIAKPGDDHSSWEEHESTIGSTAEMAEILSRLGFKPICTIEKTRRSFRLKGMHVMLEDIDGFGLGVEVEIITTKSKSEEAKARIEALFNELGIGKSRLVPKSITNMILRERSRF